MIRTHLRSLLLPALLLIGGIPPALGQSEVLGWGEFVFNSAWGNEPFASVVARGAHSVGLRANGTVVAFGSNQYGQCDVPVLPPGIAFVAIAAGDAHSLGCRSDGLLAAWGDNAGGQCNVPSPGPGGSFLNVAGGDGPDPAHRAATRSTRPPWSD